MANNLSRNELTTTVKLLNINTSIRDKTNETLLKKIKSKLGPLLFAAFLQYGPQIIHQMIKKISGINQNSYIATFGYKNLNGKRHHVAGVQALSNYEYDMMGA